jgi:prolyl 4-hydroxylase
MKVLVLLLIVVIFLYIAYPRYHEPKILKNFIPHEHCDYIIDSAKDKLQTSTIAKERHIDENVRKSETAWLEPTDPIVNNVMNKCLSLTDRQFKNCEKIQVLKYKPGGFYKPHQDAFEDDKNRRMYTCIIALNEEYEGGATVFPNLKKKYKLNKGDVLFFNTLNEAEWMCEKALHGGEPVEAGEKWICNMWIRKHPISND